MFLGDKVFECSSNIRMFFKKRKKSNIWKWFFGSCFVVLITFLVFSYYAIRNFDLSSVIDNNFLQNTIRAELNEGQNKILDVVPVVFGFTKPKTYLFLFQNNTELRPGGGFIGVYAVVTVDRGKMEIVEVEGSGVLDKKTLANWQPVPPEPISKYLGVSQWYFSDGNWSPDFGESAKKVLELYKGEGGVNADDIDVVVGITPTVLERLMNITGDFTIDGIEFTSENVTEQLEYEVEYGYESKGMAFEDRKSIIRPFMEALVGHIKDNLFERYDDYYDVLFSLAHEKHLVFFSQASDLQTLVDNYGLSADVVETNHDMCCGLTLISVLSRLTMLSQDHLTTQFPRDRLLMNLSQIVIWLQRLWSISMVALLIGVLVHT